MNMPSPGTAAVLTTSWQRSALAALQKAGLADERTSAEQVEEILSSVTHDGVRSAPLYTAESGSAGAGLPGEFPFVRGTRAASAGSGWDIRQRYDDPDADVTAATIAADLASGTTSLWLVLGDHGLPVDALPGLLATVPYAPGGLVLDAGDLAAEAIEAWSRASPAAATGNLGLDPLGVRARLGAAPRTGLAEAVAVAARHAFGHPGRRAFTVDATPYHDAGGGDTEELGCAAATGVAYLRAMTEAGLDTAAAFAQLEFRYAATADQFATIVKFRAARRMWARVAQVCGVPSAGAQRQHAVTSSAMMTARDPWSNLLRTTLAGFAAGVGSADAITIQPFDRCLGRSDPEALRLARNTHAILLEEANIARVADPAGGSWYVEHLTTAVAEKAWSWFAEIERAGGMAAALDSGLIAQRLAGTHARRRAAVAHRRDPITGVSEFAALDEQRLCRAPAVEPAGGGLPRHRHADDFESLRDRADAHTTATGSRPAVFLATLGPQAVHAARSGFAANLFAAGGIATVHDDAGDDPAEVVAAFRASGLTVACLCSSDKRYTEAAAAVATGLKAAGARRVWLAGRPAPYEGVDSYLHTGCDAVAVLEATLHDLEVA